MNRLDPATAWARLRDGVRTQLWPLPTTAVVLAITLGVGLPGWEARGSRTVPTWLDDYLFTGGADAARAVLEAVAGSLITVTALTFSLTVLTLQLASSQFSPRLLRTFTRDLVVQATLGLFLATFAYALTVLRTVRTPSGTQSEFVPQVSVTLAYLLAVASVVGLILFLAHLAQTIRVESMLRSVHDGASANLARELDPQSGPPAEVQSLVPPRTARTLTTDCSGFLVRVKEEELLARVVEAGGVALVDVAPGTWVAGGTPVGGWWPDQEADDTASGPELDAVLVTSFERATGQDVGFGLRQLTDVAVKALSPGVNDPTTAVHALGHASSLLREMAQCDLGPRVLRDDDGRVRVVLARPDLGAMLRLSQDEPARYGASEPAVLLRLFSTLREVAWGCAPHQRAPIGDALARLRRVVARQALDDADAAELEEAAHRVALALDGHWDASGRR